MGHTTDASDAATAALDDLVSRVVHARAEIARMQADETALLAEAAEIVLARERDRHAAGRRTPHDLPLREVTSELGAAMRLSDRTVQERMSTASTLVDSFQATFASLREGRVDLAHAGAIIDSGAIIADPVMRAEYERIVLDAAQFETPHRLRALARVVAARIDPTMVAELQQRARGTRKVRVTDIGDGMARLLADLPAVLAHAIHDRLTQMAYDVRAAAVEAEAGADARVVSGESTESAQVGGRVMVVTGSKTGSNTATDAATVGESLVPRPVRDDRTMDELRADIFADMILTGAPSVHGEGDALSAIRAHVQISIPVLTAAGIGDEPALLAGYGPIDRETARRLAADAPGWDRVMFHPHTGAPLGVDNYRPSAELRRFLRVRDERCRFPGCTQRPWRCDLDHTIDHALGGETRECNLAHLCRRHHIVKHATGWQVRQLGHGTLEWISLTGRRYLDRPPSLVQFVPSLVLQPTGPPGDDDPPF